MYIDLVKSHNLCQMYSILRTTEIIDNLIFPSWLSYFSFLLYVKAVNTQLKTILDLEYFVARSIW
jgi:hypothetical protein